MNGDIEKWGDTISIEGWSKKGLNLILTPANQNHINIDRQELLAVQKLYYKVCRLDCLAGINIYNMPPHKLKNYLWFCKFEIEYRQDIQEQTRKRLKIVK